MVIMAKVVKTKNLYEITFYESDTSFMLIAKDFIDVIESFQLAHPKYLSLIHI